MASDIILSLLFKRPNHFTLIISALDFLNLYFVRPQVCRLAVFTHGTASDLYEWTQRGNQNWVMLIWPMAGPDRMTKF